LAVERAKRLVELGHDVVLLLDSITRLGRAYNLAAPASGRILSGGVDSTRSTRRSGSSARRATSRTAGSLTILATALVETGSADGRGDLRGVQGHRQHGAQAGRKLADKRIFPAVDVDPFRHP